MLRPISFAIIFLAVGSTACSKSADLPSSNGSSTPVAAASPNSPAAATTPARATAGTNPKIDACTLLSSADIQSVQGESVKESKLSGQTAGGLTISQCFYSLPTFTNSISLLVAQRGEGAGATDPKDFFREHFQRAEAGEKDKDRREERDRDRRKLGEEEEEEGGPPPEKVSGLGDEAYWTGTRVGGALYVLKGNSYLRISIGGPADQSTKLKKSKTLAAKALARL